MTYHPDYYEIEICYDATSSDIIASLVIPCRPMVGDVIYHVESSYRVKLVAYLPGDATSAGCQFAGFVVEVEDYKA